MVPDLLGLLGGLGAGLALAPALRVLTWPLLGITVLMLERGWYLEMAHRGGRRAPCRRPASLVLMAWTVLAAVLWGIRFSGLLGMRPF